MKTFEVAHLLFRNMTEPLTDDVGHQLLLYGFTSQSKGSAFRDNILAEDGLRAGALHKLEPAYLCELVGEFPNAWLVVDAESRHDERFLAADGNTIRQIGYTLPVGAKTVPVECETYQLKDGKWLRSAGP